jgi:transposase
MKQAKRIFPPLSEMERAMLQRIHRQHTKAYMRDRAQMVLLSDQRYTQRTIADILHTTARTVHTILSRYRQKRLAGVCRKRGSGALPGLDGKQLDTLSQWVVHGPSLLSYSLVRWTTKTLRVEVDKRFRVPLTRERIRQLLHALGFSWKRAKAIPDTLEEETRHQAQQRLEELWEQAAQEEIILLLEDETFGHLQEHPGYGGRRVGHPQRIPQVQGKGLVVTFGGVDPIRGRTH